MFSAIQNHLLQIVHRLDQEKETRDNQIENIDENLGQIRRSLWGVESSSGSDRVHNDQAVDRVHIEQVDVADARVGFVTGDDLLAGGVHRGRSLGFPNPHAKFSSHAKAAATVGDGACASHGAREAHEAFADHEAHEAHETHDNLAAHADHGARKAHGNKNKFHTSRKELNAQAACRKILKAVGNINDVGHEANLVANNEFPAGVEINVDSVINVEDNVDGDASRRHKNSSNQSKKPPSDLPDAISSLIISSLKEYKRLHFVADRSVEFLRKL
ncbi:hypothetical protein SUGI_1501280 [Cryptomeria japonica]|uniref:Uncharacterized protein n=1 Tax=Cryptomeria japonica TaxID=3369 RepID=A0AAD3NSV8_CRYJA|nr:hypothetical protein SUGI_1501280 [Cryptomeria japonica]